MGENFVQVWGDKYGWQKSIGENFVKGMSEKRWVKNNMGEKNMGE